MKRAKAARERISEVVTKELDAFTENRSRLIDQSETERTHLNYLAFTITGAVLGLSPESLQNDLVALGLIILVLNAFIFGYVAQTRQRSLNIKHFEDAFLEEVKIITPYYRAYDLMIAELDTPQGLTQTSYTHTEEQHRKFYEWHAEREPSFAPKTKFAVGYWYIAYYTLGLISLGLGLIMKYNLNTEYIKVF